MKLGSKLLITAVALTVSAPAISARAADAAAGKAVYEKKCQNCHGADGKGDAKMAAKLKVEMSDLSKPSEKSDADLLKLLQEGKKPMPGYAKTLDAAAIENVLAYAKSLSGK